MWPDYGKEINFLEQTEKSQHSFIKWGLETTRCARLCQAEARVARSGQEKAPFARYTRFLAGAAKIIALR